MKFEDLPKDADAVRATWKLCYPGRQLPSDLDSHYFMMLGYMHAVAIANVPAAEKFIELYKLELIKRRILE